MVPTLCRPGSPSRRARAVRRYGRGGAAIAGPSARPVHGTTCRTAPREQGKRPRQDRRSKRQRPQNVTHCARPRACSRTSAIRKASLVARSRTDKADTACPVPRTCHAASRDQGASRISGRHCRHAVRASRRRRQFSRAPLGSGIRSVLPTPRTGHDGGRRLRRQNGNQCAEHD
jgi:hypothetical protein